jgi:hypothetical protein
VKTSLPFTDSSMTDIHNVLVAADFLMRFEDSLG